ncbi:RagB/SusD family nutrient uptake outer membrane protein [Sphingobacterium paucimobilis]|uniref:SusD-like N-terminal domain-containing protein n=1 Tax=Sphingobacterium paucimobilis HER1398 TaxID=1346330 RepID=U2J5C1_9SPHI|nr:RagB/SusD family nutrient uptake outer membrane protein [Sphingobacterium paucimobilis]ERJ60119.1 hypothetical protein M472_15245 [Sphingobacterium paucimobilis HER1398]
MKKIKYLILLPAALFSLNSCNKYLDVNPKTEMRQDVLFDSEKGFKDALTGVYIQMKSSLSYGNSLTQGTIEALISSWDVTSGTVEQKLGQFNYGDESVINQFNAIFSKQYATIASINAILDNIDKKKSLFKDPKLFTLIKSEAIGLRAFIHLDLLRLYGPIPSDSEKGNQLAYVTTFSKDINQRLSYSEYKSMIMKDISDALEMSKDVDPFLKVSMSQMRSPSVSTGFNPEDNFFAYRYLKMNYYALKGLQARAYLWFGEKDKAFLAAKEVIEAKNDNGTLKFPLATSADYTSKDYTLTREHLFGLYDYKMYDSYISTYQSGKRKKGSTESTIKNTLYGNTGSDMRESALWTLLTLSNASKVNVIRKYEVVEPKTVTIATDFKQIPLIRTSEMYLIAAECAPYVEGINYFKDFYTARNKANIPLPQNEGALLTELVKEYRREFYGEGQAFYNYKRHNSPRTAVIFAPAAAAVNYLLPLPTVENVNQ